MGIKTRFRKSALQAERDGGYFHDMKRHFACYTPRGETLVVGFDNMKSRDQPGAQFPWRYEVLRRHGVSHLGVMMRRRNDWYRHSDLFDFFDTLTNTGFFRKFRRVVFYGSSMGAFGACAFAAAAPGADVVALTPQSTLAADIVPFEHRYRRGFARGDWTDPRYRDGATGVAQARKVVLVYDPYFAPDRAHAERLSGPQVTPLICPFTGHKAVRMLHNSGLLKGLLHDVIHDQLEPVQFRHDFRAVRLQSPGYRRMLDAAWQARLARKSPVQDVA